MSATLVRDVKDTFIEKFKTEPLLIFSPGRINIIGEHTDYNDGFVFPAAVNKGIAAAIQKSNSDNSTAIALDLNSTIEFELDKLKPSKEGSWENYVFGVVAEIQNKNKIIGNFNIIFKGNTTSWIKFANSLKLRILMRQTKVSGRGAYITAEVNKIAAEGSGILSGADVGVNPGYVASAGQINPIYNTYGYTETGARVGNNNWPRITDFMVKELIKNADTFRLKRFAYAPGNGDLANPGVSVKPAIASNYIGIPFGSSSGYLPGASSAVGPVLLVRGQYNRPIVLMTAAEVQFCLAEAKQRYGSSVNLTGANTVPCVFGSSTTIISCPGVVFL